MPVIGVLPQFVKTVSGRFYTIKRLSSLSQVTRLRPQANTRPAGTVSPWRLLAKTEIVDQNNVFLRKMAKAAALFERCYK